MPTGQSKARKIRRNLTIEQREREVFELYTSDDRIGFREVGKRLGITHTQARKDLASYKAKQDEDDAAIIDAWRVKVLAKLNRKFVRLEKIATGESLKNKRSITPSRKLDLQLKAEAEQVKVLKEIADITGIKAAQKHEHSGTLDLTTRVIEPGD